MPTNVPSEDPERKKPAQGVRIDLGGKTVIFVTVSTKDRIAWLACDEAHQLLRKVWNEARAWLSGVFVIVRENLPAWKVFGRNI